MVALSPLVLGCLADSGSPPPAAGIPVLDHTVAAVTSKHLRLASAASINADIRTTSIALDLAQLYLWEMRLILQLLAPRGLTRVRSLPENRIRVHLANLNSWRSSTVRHPVLDLESMVKNHISSKTGFGYLAIRRTSFLLWFQGLSSSSSGSSSTSKTPSRQESHSSSSSSTLSSSPTVSEIKIREREDGINNDISPVQVSTSIDDRSGQPDRTQANNHPKPNEKETTTELGNPSYSEISEWLSEPTSKWRDDLGEHSVYTHFPKEDQNYKGPVQKVPRAEKFGDLITDKSQGSQ